MPVSKPSKDTSIVMGVIVALFFLLLAHVLIEGEPLKDKRIKPMQEKEDSYIRTPV